MITQELDKSSVKLLFEDGVVWALDGQGMPRNTKLSVAAFFRQSLFPTSRRLRIVGWQRNVDLILAAWRAVGDGMFAGLEICTPRCAPSWAGAAQALYSARAVEYPASVGGWRQFGPSDEKAYALAACFASESPPHCSDVTTALLSHPAWPALSFIPHLNKIATARLLALIVDPRWHIDVGHPDREDLLPRFLGLHPTCKSRSVSDEELSSRRRLVLACWKNDEAPSVPSSCQFLWSWWLSHNRDDLAASIVFVQYLRQTWLDAVCVRQELFVPEYFFSSHAEAEDFRKYMLTGSK